MSILLCMIDKNKIIAVGGLIVVIGLLVCGILTAGCIGDDKKAPVNDDEKVFSTDLEYYYIPSISKHISSGDNDFESMKKKYGDEMVLIYRSFKTKL